MIWLFLSIGSLDNFVLRHCFLCHIVNGMKSEEFRVQTGYYFLPDYKVITVSLKSQDNYNINR